MWVSPTSHSYNAGSQAFDLTSMSNNLLLSTSGGIHDDLGPILSSRWMLFPSFKVLEIACTVSQDTDEQHGYTEMLKIRAAQLCVDHIFSHDKLQALLHYPPSTAWGSTQLVG